MAISVEEYLAAVHRNLPESRGMVAHLAENHQDIALVARVNIGLTFLLVWSWSARDLDVCARVLDVMELAVLDTEEDDYAPVYNSAMGMVEHVHRDIYVPEEFAEFVETWPATLRERGVRMSQFDRGWNDDEGPDWDDAGPGEFRIPFGMRVRWAVRHPISSRLGTRMRFAG